MSEIQKLHAGRFSGSKLQCPRQMALHVLGYEAEISKRLKTIFEEGQEHDEVMKEEALEEFDDFVVPKSTLFRFTGIWINDRTKISAEVILSPDGLRPDEVVEFKSLSTNNYNSIRTVEDLSDPDTSPLFRKYYNQTQMYAGAFEKKKIRMRLRNKRNFKTKDIIYDADPDHYVELRDMILEVQKMINDGELPPISCPKTEQKRCMYRTACKQLQAREIEQAEEKKLSSKEAKKLSAAAAKYTEYSIKIKAMEDAKSIERDRIAEIMHDHGKREVDVNGYLVKYGIRYKTIKDRETIDELVLEGKIPVKEVPEEYVFVEREEDK